VVSARRFLTVCLVALLLGVVLAAFADPPDPTWIGGYWDDDDFDTVVAYIASALATVARTDDVDAKPCLVWIQGTDPAAPGLATAPRRNTSRPRAPPLASLPLC
jgi:hypothetical protein